MKKFSFVISVLFSVQQLSAQVPEDAIRISWNIPSGTARSMAIGGAMGSLGGDFTSTFVNPAGLGFYKKGEFVITPGISFLNAKSDYLGTTTKANPLEKFNLGATGFVLCNTNQYSKWQNRTFSIGINRTANFNGRTHYKGVNNFSSFSETYAEEFSQSGLPINTVLYSAPLSFATKLANYTYLIDTATVNGSTEVVGLPLRNAVLSGTAAQLLQQKDIVTKGGITEVSLATAANMDDKVYIGGSIGIPIVNFERTSTISETDATTAINNFNTASYKETYKSSGVGLNAKFGAIFKPDNTYRVGLAIQTPTIYGLKERTTGTMTTDLEGYVTGKRTANADSIYTQYGADIPQYRYDLITPWKFLVSGSYIFSGVADVTKQKGFITADIEYVTHQSSKFYSSDQESDDNYYSSVNQTIKASYKNAFNFRVGGEMKFNTLMARLGFAYFGKPYDDSQIKAHLMNLSGGVGYRDKGVFIDVTYIQSLNRDANFPYRISDKANTYADVRNTTGNLIITAGFKF
ncbi:MAG: hypothetical protein ABI415_05540 [Flavitalea sp.]